MAVAPLPSLPARALRRLAAAFPARADAALPAAPAAPDPGAWYRALIENGSDVVSVIERDGTVRFQSPSLERVLGYAPDALVGTNLLDVVHPDDAPWISAGFEAGIARPGAHDRPSLCRWRHRDGTWRWMEHKRNVLLHDPTVRGVVLNSRDVTDRVALEEQLTHRVLHDGLTGLPNRALFSERLDQALGLAGLRGEPVAVVVLDLDGFKRVNDTLGHGAGDIVLIACARRLAARLGEGHILARFGGDEFAVLLDAAGSPEEAAGVAQELLGALEEPLEVQGRRFALSGSAGVALASGHEAGAEDVLRNADIALYEAKADGRRRYSLFQPRMHAAVLERLELEEELQRALARDELVLHYQPIVALGDGTVVGAEALVRWNHPERGLLPPGAFIEVAEQAGLIVPMGAWILAEAVRQAAAWRAEGVGDGRLWVSVNLSVEQLADPAVVDHVASALEANALPAELLVLELTESAVMRDVEAAKARLVALKALGARVALDDFGEGHSSLAYLASLPLDLLKIPKSFIDPGANPALARAAVELARAFGLATISEGVEEPAQRARLLALGSALAQGYLFARPGHPDAVAELAAAGGADAGARTRRAAAAPRAATRAS